MMDNFADALDFIVKLLISAGVVMAIRILVKIERVIARKLGLEAIRIERKVLRDIIEDAVRSVEESEMCKDKKLSSGEKEDAALKVVRKECLRKGLGNPVPELNLRDRIKAAVNRLYRPSV